MPIHRGAVAMLDCQESENEQHRRNCSHCQGKATGCGDNHLWVIRLDQDLVATLKSLYPAWFKDFDMNLDACNGSESDQENPIIPLSHSREPDAEVEDTSLHKTMDKNKESLKVKLMLRRPINQLVDQGIMPPLNSPPAFHEQRQKLERAKMSDILKNKIQRRPDRQELIQQHILEDPTADHNVQEKQCQLKKTNSLDGLNDKLSCRLGPLNLAKGNIFNSDEILAQAIREGSIGFQGTFDVSSPPMRVLPEEDSGSDFALSPSPTYDFNEHSQSSLLSYEASETSPHFNHGSPGSLRTSFSLSPPSSVSSPLSIFPAAVSPLSQEPPTEILINNQLQNKDSVSKNRKKAKPKMQPKAKIIKFHEYKGPPSAQKVQPAPSISVLDLPRDIEVEQQQMFLQWQVENQHKYPFSIMPLNLLFRYWKAEIYPSSVKKQNGDQLCQNNQVVNTLNQPTQQPENFSSQKLLSKLEDLKVCDLKAELKKRNLPVSGSKPLLIERLKSYAELPQNLPLSSSAQNYVVTTVSSDVPLPANVGNMLLEDVSLQNSSADISSPSSPLNGSEQISRMSSSSQTTGLFLNALNSESNLQTVQPSSVIQIEEECISVQNLEPRDNSESSSPSLSNDDIVQLQQRCIENLQRELQRSQLQLQQSITCHTSQHPGLSTPEPLPIVSLPIASSPAQSDSATVPIATTTAFTSVTSSSSTAQEATSEKLLQRQLIYQQLQQKIQQQQQLQMQKQQHGQQQKNVKTQTLAPPAPANQNTNSTLTALLKSQPVNSKSNPGKTLNASPLNVTHTGSGTLIGNSSLASLPANSHLGDPTVATGNSDSSVLTLPFQKGTAAIGSSNKVGNHRAASLPSFSALMGSKPTPTRSNTDPHFFITRPPPDYNEATRQLNKAKQMASRHSDGNPKHSKKHKSGVKSQAVDDVLEILIKNGELPPSAAQEPSTPSVAETPKRDPTVPTLFSSTSDPLGIVAGPVNIVPDSLMPTSITTSMPCETPPLHVESLQSVLDMTPPSSAGLVEPSSGAPSSLDFDFQIDMDDFEPINLEMINSEDHPHLELINHDESPHMNMVGNPDEHVNFEIINQEHSNIGTINRNDHNLEMLSHEERLNISMTSDKPMFHADYLKEGKLTGNVSNVGGGINGSASLYNMLDSQDRGMDSDLIEWLEVLEDASGVSANPSSNFHHSNYSIANDHDPLLSNIANSNDPLDLFAVDDMDFKPSSDLNLLVWDKVDFTT